MSRVEEIKQQIEELEKKTQELQKELEFEKQKAEIEYSFKNGEEYWVLWHDGYLRDYIWDGSDFDKERYSQGNIFKTKAEAKRESDRRALLICFRQFRDKCNGDWKPELEEVKYYIFLKYENFSFFVSSCMRWNYFNMFGYFKNKADAERAIQLFGDEIKRLWVDE